MEQIKTLRLYMYFNVCAFVQKCLNKLEDVEYKNTLVIVSRFLFRLSLLCFCSLWINRVQFAHFNLVHSDQNKQKLGTLRCQ